MCSVAATMTSLVGLSASSRARRSPTCELSSHLWVDMMLEEELVMDGMGSVAKEGMASLV